MLLRVEHEVGSVGVGVHLSLRVRRMTHESLGHSSRCGGIRSSIEEPRLVPQQAGGGAVIVVVIAIVGLEVSSTKLRKPIVIVVVTVIDAAVVTICLIHEELR